MSGSDQVSATRPTTGLVWRAKRDEGNVCSAHEKGVAGTHPRGTRDIGTSCRSDVVPSIVSLRHAVRYASPSVAFPGRMQTRVRSKAIYCRETVALAATISSVLNLHGCYLAAMTTARNADKRSRSALKYEKCDNVALRPSHIKFHKNLKRKKIDQSHSSIMLSPPLFP